MFNKRHRYEQISWLPVLTAFLVASVVGGKHLSNPPPAVPATVSAILTFASTFAGFSIGYSPFNCDFTNYCESLEKLFSQNLASKIR